MSVYIHLPYSFSLISGAGIYTKCLAYHYLLKNQISLQGGLPCFPTNWIRAHYNTLPSYSAIFLPRHPRQSYSCVCDYCPPSPDKHTPHTLHWIISSSRVRPCLFCLYLYPNTLHSVWQLYLFNKYFLKEWINKQPYEASITIMPTSQVTNLCRFK